MNSTVGKILLVTASLGTGFGIGYFVGKKLEQRFHEAEIESIKEHYAPFRKEGVFATVEGAVEALVPPEEIQRIVESNGYSLESDEEIPEHLPVPSTKDRFKVEEDYLTSNISNVNRLAKNLFEDLENKPEVLTEDEAEVFNQDVSPTENPDADKLPERTPDKPFIVAVDEFMSTESDEFDKISLLYFEEDETLVDERETIIPNVEEIVGESNLHHFGMGSRDRNALYIRNEKFHAYYEVIRDQRSYKEVVLGIRPERNSPRRMRNDDE